MAYRIIRENSLVHVRWSGILSNQDLASLFEELPRASAEAGFAPPVLHTFDEVERVDIEPTALVRHSRDRVWTLLPNPIRSASVGASPLTYGYALMIKRLNANPMIEMEVFASVEDALAWLSPP